MELQDQWQLDIPMLFYCAWMGARGQRLAADDIAAADHGVALWRSEVIRPLREIRRRMKTGPHPAPNDETEALRAKVKAAELQSEQLELRWLEDGFSHAGCNCEPTTALAINLRLCFEHYAGQEPANEGPLAAATTSFGSTC